MSYNDNEWLKSLSIRDLFRNERARGAMILNYLHSQGDELFKFDAAGNKDYNGQEIAFKKPGDLLKHLALNPKRSDWIKEAQQRSVALIKAKNKQKEMEDIVSQLWECALLGYCECWLKTPSYHTIEEICDTMGLTHVRHRGEDQFFVKW